MELDFEIVHRPGISHQATDALSLLPTNGLLRTVLEDDIPVLVVTWSNRQALNSSSAKAVDISQAEINSSFGNDSEILPEIIEAQQSCAYWSPVHQYVSLLNTTLTYDKDFKLVRKATIDGATQNLVPRSLRSRMLSLAQYSRLSVHPGKRRMYDSLKRKFFWPHILSDCYAVDNGCIECPFMGTKFNHERKLELCPPARPLKFVTIDILGPLPRTKAGILFSLSGQIGIPS